MYACHSVSFDAGNLYITVDRITSKAEEVFHCDFCCIFYLMNIKMMQIGKTGSSKRRSRSDFGLTA